MALNMTAITSMLGRRRGFMYPVAHLVRCVRLLTTRSKIIFFFVITFQTFTAVLDLLGLALMITLITGLQGIDANRSNSSSSIFPFIARVTSAPNSNLLILLVVTIFVLKGVVAMTLHSANLNLLAGETNRLVKSISHEIFENRFKKYNKLTSQDMAFSIFNATEIIFKDTLLPFTIILSDSVLVLLIAMNLYFTIPVLFVPCAMYFGWIFLVLWKSEKRKTKYSYKNQIGAEILSRSYVVETVMSLREILVSDKLIFFINKITAQRSKGIAAGSEIAISQLRPKYVYEMALFGGIGIMAVASEITGNSDSLIIYMSMFVISASRMIPSMLRIQFYTSIFRKSNEQSNKIFEILNLQNIASTPINEESESLIPIQKKKFEAKIEIENLVFSYNENQSSPVIRDISLKINTGEVIAVVGPSGAGKSTFIDLILGFLEPSSGEVRISSKAPRDALKLWPGCVSYLPQNITIFHTTLFENVALGCEDTSPNRLRVQSLLSKVGLSDFMEKLENGLDTNLTEMGSSLSGGQIQKIGIARALFYDPEVLIFDESTSSLDSVSENEVMELLLSWRNEKTLIFVAHRLSTIKTANRILYLNQGVVEAEGNFENLRKKVPDFETQVQLFGMPKLE